MIEPKPSGRTSPDTHKEGLPISSGPVSSGPKKVCIVTPDFQGRAHPAPSTTTGLAAELARHGHEVNILHVKGESPRDQEQETAHLEFLNEYEIQFDLISPTCAPEDSRALQATSEV